MANEYSSSPEDPRARNHFRSAPWQNVPDRTITLDTCFEDAADRWFRTVAPPVQEVGILTGRRIVGRRIRSTTAQSYSENVRTLKLFFGGMILSDIRLDHIRGYEDDRVAGAAPFIRKRRPNQNVEPGPCPVNPNKANQEIFVLKRILHAANLWGEEQRQLHIL